MANHSSAKKSIRQTIRRSQVNKKIFTYLGTLEKKIRNFVQKKDKKQATEQLKYFAQAINRSVNKGLIHANKASRKQSRLAILVNRS